MSETYTWFRAKQKVQSYISILKTLRMLLIILIVHDVWQFCMRKHKIAFCTASSSLLLHHKLPHLPKSNKECSGEITFKRQNVKTHQISDKKIGPNWCMHTLDTAICVSAWPFKLLGSYLIKWPSK